MRREALWLRSPRGGPRCQADDVTMWGPEHDTPSRRGLRQYRMCCQVPALGSEL
jgi:hypothetical protein